jgi:Transposase domain (DUF772)
MRPKKNMPTNAVDLFRSRLDQIINLKHELAQLAGKIDWNWLDEQIAPLYSETGRPAVETRFMLGLLLLKHIFGLSDAKVCERWVENPYFQYFTGEEFFQHSFPHERSGLGHWRKRLSVNRIDHLTVTRFEETVVTSLRPEAISASCKGVHTLSFKDDLMVIDAKFHLIGVESIPSGHGARSAPEAGQRSRVHVSSRCQACLSAISSSVLALRSHENS